MIALNRKCKTIQFTSSLSMYLVYYKNIYVEQITINMFIDIVSLFIFYSIYPFKHISFWKFVVHNFKILLIKSTIKFICSMLIRLMLPILNIKYRFTIFVVCCKSKCLVYISPSDSINAKEAHRMWFHTHAKKINIKFHKDIMFARIFWTYIPSFFCYSMLHRLSDVCLPA